MTMELRGTGRTTAALRVLYSDINNLEGFRIGFFVVGKSHEDSYNLGLLTEFVLPPDLKFKFNRGDRTVTFEHGSRLRFINYDHPTLVVMGPSDYLIRGYRRDTPIVWDHHAWDMWIQSEANRARNATRAEGREHGDLSAKRPPMDKGKSK